MASYAEAAVPVAVPVPPPCATASPSSSAVASFLSLSGTADEPTPALTLGSGAVARCRVKAEVVDANTFRIRSNALPNYVPFVAGRRADGGVGFASGAGLGDVGARSI